MTTRLNKERLKKSIESLRLWVEAREYKGYEPFDALLSPARILTCGRPILERILLQIVRQSPINLRPMLGIRPHESSMGRGCIASGYLNLYRCTGILEHKEKAISSLEWLMKNKSPFHDEYTWGHHFDWVSRAGPHPKWVPTIVWTSLIGHTFMDAYEITQSRQYMDVGASICRWILSLPREVTDHGTCISYVPFRQDSIHNSNMLGASMLARYGAHSSNGVCMELAESAMRYSCSHQLSSGAWYYGEWPMHRWIDSFHTGYNLDSLKYYLEYTNTAEFRPNLREGYRYFKDTFFEKDGLPRYYDKKTYPIDIQCASQAITTLTNFSGYDSESGDMAERVAQWTISHMQDEKGFFYYRRLPGLTVRIPMFHWGQATMFKALTFLYGSHYSRREATKISV